MRIVPINEAEAIIEPFWDGGSSEHPRNKQSLLGQYDIQISPNVVGNVSQSWCAVVVKIERAEPGTVAITMQRPCDISIANYDTLRLFGSLPHWLSMTIRAEIDGQMQTVMDHVLGVDTNDEFDGAISGQRLTMLQLEFALTEARFAAAQLAWLGLANTVDQARMEARISPYTPDWPGCLEDHVNTLQSEIGIFFDSAELAEIRTRITHEPYKSLFATLRQQALQGMQMYPEGDIGYLIPKPDRRWCRNRDMRRKSTAGIMELLAFIGLVEESVEMCTMAARMALSAAHCDTWCESIMGIFPGATWHHRSFTEEVYCRACALVLDWAGACLTPHGKQVIRDAIIMKGLPRIESDFKRMEYIRHMNQGIVFSSGRIIGLLSLLPAYPRYASLVTEAERDLHEMIDDYVQPDGGTLEGMAYWNYTFGTTMPLLYALARYHKRTLQEYAPASIAKTGTYALAMLSTVGDGTTYLPINDAHGGNTISPSLAAAYCQISDSRDWRDLYAAMMSKLDVRGDFFHLIIAPTHLDAPGPVVKPKFVALMDTGQVSSVRHDSSLGYVHLHLCSGPTDAGHYHQDKGSFILEVDGEELIMDRGVTSYDHPEVNLIGMASRHNLLYPESPDGPALVQPAHVDGARLSSALDREGMLLLATNNAGAWASGLFQTNIRRVFSPTPDLFFIDDQVAIAALLPMTFRLNSRYPMEQRDGEVWVRGSRASLCIVPLNWQPSAIQISVEGIDCHLEPVNLLRMATGPAQHYRLLTAIQVVPNDAGSERLWNLDSTDTISAIRGSYAIELSTKDAAQLGVTVRQENAQILQALCLGDQWRL